MTRKRETANVQEPGSPFDPALWATYLWVLAVSILGGIVSFMRKVRDGAARRFNFAELVGEIVTAALVGVATFWLCKSAEVNQWMTAALIAITSHMGTRALFRFERFVDRILPAREDRSNREV